MPCRLQSKIFGILDDLGALLLVTGWRGLMRLLLPEMMPYLNSASTWELVRIDAAPVGVIEHFLQLRCRRDVQCETKPIGHFLPLGRAVPPEAVLRQSCLIHIESICQVMERSVLRSPPAAGSHHTIPPVNQSFCLPVTVYC